MLRTSVREPLAADIPDGCWNQELKISWPGDFPNSYPDYLLNDAKAGAEFWSSRRDFLGSGRLIPVAHGYSILSANAKVEWTGVLTDETYGVAVCSDHIVLINSDHEDDFNRSNSLMRTAMAHELGHILGLGHVGDYDSWDGLPPIMRPCFGAVLVASGLSQDDWGAANGLRDRSLGGFYNVTANSSFEDGVLKWGEQNTTLAAYSGGVDGSLKYARMTGYDSTSAAFNTTRVADHQGHDIAGMKARANYRTVSSSDSGYVKFALRLNYGDYPFANDTCGYPDFKAWDGSGDRDLDQPRSSWNWYFESVDCIPVSSWSFCDTPEVGTTVEGDVQDMRVAVYNRMRTAQGYWTSVAIDRARALVRFS